MFRTARSHFTNLALIILLGISPVQNISAAVSGCMQNGDTMRHHMTMSDSDMQHMMSKPGTNSPGKHNCCEQNKLCQFAHCASAYVAVMTTSPVVNVKYTVNTVLQTYKISLAPFYPASLYRPPKA